MKHVWSIAQAQPQLAGELATRLGISSLLAQCLLNRGVADPDLASGFLDPRLKNLSDPFLLPDMSLAVDRLFAAREKQEPLIIFGDYDVDGVTASALLLTVLRNFGWHVECYLPHRMDEGYGLSSEAVENCLRQATPGLLVALDCGSTSVNAIGALRQRAIDVIVVDHHQLSDPRPPALAIVNPQAHCSAATGGAGRFTELCSAGLAFKLAHALVKRGRSSALPGAADYDLRPLLDLVALGTIADLVPVTGENRILVAAGLQRLNHTTRPGLLALKKVAQCPPVLQSLDVGFQLAPRLNAAGRMEHAQDALQLLLTNDPAEAAALAQQLDSRNRERQQVERTIAEEAARSVSAKFKPELDYVIVEANNTWHVGVVGIVASRVLQRFYRPTIIFGGDKQELRGSGRSIVGFDLAAALRDCSDLLLRHGGHAMAAGVSIKTGQVDAFRARLNELARARLTAQLLQPPLRLDAEVKLSEIGLREVLGLDGLKPLGQGNPTVQFCARALTHQRPPKRMGTDHQHLKCWLTDGTATVEAVWWGAGSESLPPSAFDLAFMPQINQYNGLTRVQLKVLDWRQAQ